MFKTSESTKKLDSALAKAQGQIQIASKDKVNPAFRSKYADITSVWEACREALSKHEVSVTQWPIHSENNKLHLVTRIAHAGEWMQGEFSIPVDKSNAHGYGSAVTYAKRFALSAALGIVSDDEVQADDDGNTASQTQGNAVKSVQQVKPKTTPAAAPKKPSEYNPSQSVVQPPKVEQPKQEKPSEFDSVSSGVQAFDVSQYANWDTPKLEAYMVEMIDKLKERKLSPAQLKGEPKAKFEAVQKELISRGNKQ